MDPDGRSSWWFPLPLSVRGAATSLFISGLAAAALAVFAMTLSAAGFQLQRPCLLTAAAEACHVGAAAAVRRALAAVLAEKLMEAAPEPALGLRLGRGFTLAAHLVSVVTASLLWPVLPTVFAVTGGGRLACLHGAQLVLRGFSGFVFMILLTGLVGAVWPTTGTS